jgi:hypothetical protein
MPNAISAVTGSALENSLPPSGSALPPIFLIADSNLCKENTRSTSLPQNCPKKSFHPLLGLKKQYA